MCVYESNGARFVMYIALRIPFSYCPSCNKQYPLIEHKKHSGQYVRVYGLRDCRQILLLILNEF